jgi:hypothetical protein
MTDCDFPQDVDAAGNLTHAECACPTPGAGPCPCEVENEVSWRASAHPLS